MNDLCTEAAHLLSDVGFTASLRGGRERSYAIFENGTVLGFVFAYGTTRELLDTWERDLRRTIDEHRLPLRRSGSKAWNLYVLLLAEGAPVGFEAVELTAVEEDLSGARKIARGGVGSVATVKNALLPLLPLQAAPRLEAVSSVAEIAARTSALDARVTEAFLSAADQAVLLNVIEESL